MVDTLPISGKFTLPHSIKRKKESKMLLYNKQKKKNQNAKGNRILISVTVLGSAGPIRFVAYENDLVVSVIETVLKSYAREGRLPLLGSNRNEFILYSPILGHEAVRPLHTIGSCGARNFMLCRKPETKMEEVFGRSNSTINAGRSLKNWIHKSFNLKVSSH